MMKPANRQVRHKLIRRPSRPFASADVNEQLCRNAQTLITAVEQSPASIVITDNEGCTQYVNPKFTRLTGYELAEVQGRTMRILKTGHTSRETYTDLWQTIKSGRDWHGRFLNKKKSGELYWEQASISPVFNPHGHITNFVAVKEDITDRVQAEQTIQDLNQRLEERVTERTQQLNRLNSRMTAMLNSNNDAIILLDEQNKLESINPAFTRMFGYEAHETDALESFALVAPESRSVFLAALAQARQQGSAIVSQYEARHKDGTLFAAACSIGLVPGNGHLVCNVHDISPLVQANRIKERFISMVNHELRTPITVILLQAQMFTSFYNRLTDAERLEKVGNINQQATVLTELINGILDLSRLDLQAKEQVIDPVNASKLAEEAIDQLRTSLDEKKQVYHFDAVCDPIRYSQLKINKDALKLVWRNLLGNAHKYTPEKGEISIRIGEMTVSETDVSQTGLLRDFAPPAGIEPGHYLVGQVEDNGYGIPAEDKPHLFDRFYRGWAEISQIPGTGLGLPLVKEIVDQYHGGIVVESEVGQGSCFTFYLPL